MKGHQYLAITQQTASWLLTNTVPLRAVTHAIADLATKTSLSRSILAIGSLRASGTSDGRLVAIWNIDYLSNRGEESWAVIRLGEPYGFLNHPEIADEVFERMVFVANQRLQGLIVDPAFIPRHFENNVHTCIAGRGGDARQYRVGWSEQAVQTGSSETKAIAIVGPTRESDEFHRSIRDGIGALASLVRSTNELVAETGSRPLMESTLLADLVDWCRPSTQDSSELGPFALPDLDSTVDMDEAFATHDWTYENWIDSTSPLTSTQRAILNSDRLNKQPLRIVGAAGSGKTLLMMLLAMRRLLDAEENSVPVRLLYIVHNAAMLNTAKQRFITLGAERFLTDDSRRLEIASLLEYSRGILGESDSPVIHSDAFETKKYQREFVSEALDEVFEVRADLVAKGPILQYASQNDDVRLVLVGLVADEISVAIKGHGLARDKKRYTESDRRLSRLHGALSVSERLVVFEIFEKYHAKVFEALEMLDCDDVAVSLLARLYTPVWEMKRRKQGVDHIFVDEAHLFNENERRLFPMMTRGVSGHVPAVLAMDEAQQSRATSMPGLGLLGFDTVASETLHAIHRSARSIVLLAFHVIQRTSDLFGPDFPNFTTTSKSEVSDEHPLVAPPKLFVAGTHGLGNSVLRQVQKLRKNNIRQIAVICHAERYWAELTSRLSAAQLPFVVLEQRGEHLNQSRPIVVLSRPETAGGQEFDAVICVGLEQGVVPPRIDGNTALAAALEQQALREMYLAFTRARYQLHIVVSESSEPSQVLQYALNDGLLIRDA